MAFESLGDLVYKVGNSLLNGSLKRILTGAGLGVVSYAGISKLLEKIITEANATLMSGEGYILSILGLGGVDKCLSMIISAYIIRATIHGANISLVKNSQ